MKAKTAPSALLKALSAALTYPAQGLESILEPLRCCAGEVSCTAWHAGLVEALAAAEAFTAPGAAQPEGAEAAQLEYTRLFIGSFKMCAPPYASYYLDGKYSGPDSWTAVPDPIGNPGRLESLCVRLPPLYHAASLNPPSCEPIPKWYQLAGVA